MESVKKYLSSKPIVEKVVILQHPLYSHRVLVKHDDSITKLFNRGRILTIAPGKICR